MTTRKLERWAADGVGRCQTGLQDGRLARTSIAADQELAAPSTA
jgi:hypothetical protein